MIQALVKIGERLKTKYPVPIVETPYLLSSRGETSPKQQKKNPHILLLDFETSGEEPLFLKGIRIEDYKPELVVTHYYFRKPSQGAAPSLSFKLPGTKRTLIQRLGILANLGYSTAQMFAEIADRVIEYINQVTESGLIAKAAPILIVIRIDEKWPSQIQRLTEPFIQNYLEELSLLGTKPILKNHGKCHICGKEGTVYGGLSRILKFYTVDKHGYAVQLNPKMAWKQYSLCEDCIFNLERGKRAIDDFLTLRFYGRKFWLLPVSTGDLSLILDRFTNFYGKVYHAGFAENVEDRVLYEASQQEESLFYHFVFVQKDNQALRIRLHIEDVLPSLLAQYVETKVGVEAEFNQTLKDKGVIKDNFYFTFFTSKNLRNTKDRPGFSDEDFYSITNQVFRRSPIDESWLLSKITARLSKEMANNDALPWWTVLEAFLSLKFLLKWGVLRRKSEGGSGMTDTLYNKEFFEQHNDFFNHPAKRALVLLGVLVQKFLGYQKDERESTPFLKALKNLRLRQSNIKTLFVSLQNKMNEYGVGHCWGDLRSGVSLSFVEAGDKWPLSSDEIGFYLAVGMALHSLPVFHSSKSNQKNKEDCV